MRTLRQELRNKLTMSEAQTISTESEAKSPVPAVASSSVSSRREVKEAEVKLKEMSRKAKERKSASAPRKPAQRQSGSNLRLVFIGGFGVGVLGILYLMLRPKEELVSEHSSRRNEVPTPNEGKEKPSKQQRQSPKKDPPKINKTEATGFEMNSF